MNTPSPSPGRIPLARLRGQKIQQPFGPLTTAAIRAAFGEMILEVPSWRKVAVHLVRHRGLFISTKHPRHSQPSLHCTCGALLARPLAGVK